MQFQNILLIDIDGLREDVFSIALGQGHIPNLARLLGGRDLSRGVQIPVVAPAPSITFCSQASLFTGAHPAQHGIPGNQFFDRFGTHSNGLPRYYAFDVGDTLAVDDAVCVFTDGLASRCLLTPTLYQRFAGRGWRSVVAGNMYAVGADIWLKPSLAALARFTKGSNLFGLSAAEYDRQIFDAALAEIERDGLPNILTIHFLGLDHESHHCGPGAQMDYLVNILDPMLGELADAIPVSDSLLIAVFSDHGQIEVIPDDRHSLRLAFPFEREIGHLFDALGLDIHDYPGEDPDCDALVAANGGVAYVYLQNRRGRWADPPDFGRDVLPVGRAFWQAHASGQYAAELEGALAGVLIRNVERDGWHAPYNALTPDGKIISLGEWFKLSNKSYIDPVNRLNNLAGLLTGDLLLISNYADGFYFGAPLHGVHGGLHPDDSRAVLAYGFPGANAEVAEKMRIAIMSSIHKRCITENKRQPSTADLLTGLESLLA